MQDDCSLGNCSWIFFVTGYRCWPSYNILDLILNVLLQFYTLVDPKHSDTLANSCRSDLLEFAFAFALIRTALCSAVHVSASLRFVSFLCADNLMHFPQSTACSPSHNATSKHFNEVFSTLCFSYSRLSASANTQFLFWYFYLQKLTFTFICFCVYWIFSFFYYFKILYVFLWHFSHARWCI